MNAILRNVMLVFALTSAVQALGEPITVTLKLKGKYTMKQLAENVHNPVSAHYNRFYEPTEIRQLAAPSDNQYNQMLADLKSEGVTVLSESPTHLWVMVRGEKAIYESLFATQIQSLAGGTHKMLVRPQVPIHLAIIESISGLDSTRKSFPKYKRMGLFPQANQGVSPTTIKTAYGFNPLYANGLTGKGVHIAIATYHGFNIDNVNQFYALSNISPAPSVDQVAFNGTATYDEDTAIETELDSEFSGMMAPGSNIHVFASATNDDGGELAMFTAILDDNRAKIVNYSWGGCEQGLTDQHRADMTEVFARAVAQGVNIFVASGDSGSDTCGDGGVTPDWPAASPYVVAVGGTTMSFSNGVLSETGWSGSGGGISGIFDLPSWQQSLGSPFVKRSYPDVAFNADPQSGQAIYSSSNGTPGWIVIGGTSMASPQWAGFLALVAEAREREGRADLGYLSPILYSMSSSNRATAMHDVTVGQNGAYSCNVGWDAVTGFGSMQADSLLNYLQAQ